TSHYSNIAIIYDSDLMCIHSLLWKKIVHIIMVYGQRTEARIQYRGTREESTRVSKEEIHKIELSAFHELGNNQERDDVMHDNINLLHIRGKNISDYAGQVLRCLFARE
ncbi:unnamed protein product, partial [Rotaria magnacalcarata]